MRSKEDADEYRYFPEPDLPPLTIGQAMIDTAQKELTLLPNDLRKTLTEAKIAVREGEVLVGEPELGRFWNEAYKLDTEQARFCLNWLVGDQVRLSGERESGLSESKLTPKRLIMVGELVASGKLSSTNSKQLLEKLWDDETEPESLAEKLKLIQQSDGDALTKVVEEVMAGNAQAVADLKAGNERALGALVGAAMKATKGQGNPRMITQLIQERL